MAASNQQVQQWANERTRVRAEQIRALKIAIEDDVAVFDDVYANLANSPTWDDDRTDGPPHLLTPNDLLGIHTFNVGFLAFLDQTVQDAAAKIAAADDQLPVVLNACVRPVGS